MWCVAITTTENFFHNVYNIFVGSNFVAERPEALEAGTVKLVGTDYDKIINEVSELLENEESYNKMSKAVNPYGDGSACKRIVDFLKEVWLILHFIRIRKW